MASASTLSNEESTDWFEDVTTRVGLSFKHNPGVTGNFLMPESIGSGGAVFDADGDGRLDVYLLQGAPAAVGASHQLFLQDSNGKFRNASAGSGLDVTGPGMGVAVGDVDNDGRPDVVVTEVGRARLFLNRGAGRFEEGGTASGLDNPRWGTSVSFLDYDRDGWLDLVIANYVDYSPTIKCSDAKGQPEYCGPQGMPGTAARLYHNRGLQGPPRFEDVTVASGLARRTGAGLGVLCADLDGDHWVDILMADDGMPNRLYRNQHNGTFVEEAIVRGLAFNALGAPVANMGIAFGDVDGNGLPDVFIPHVAWEQPALWMQNPAGLFLDQTIGAGLANLSLRGTGFGTTLADLDLDGDLDLVVVNGRIRRGEQRWAFLPGMDSFWEPYAEPNQLFANDGTGHFRDVSGFNAVLCGQAAVGRGLAYADFDNDGAFDLLVMNTGAPARLLHNVIAARRRNHWLVVRALDPRWGGRDAYGAEITVRTGNRHQTRLIQPGSSYLVSNDPRAHFGLGSTGRVEAIDVVWPDGESENFPGGDVDRIITLQHGAGISR